MPDQPNVQVLDDEVVVNAVRKLPCEPSRLHGVALSKVAALHPALPTLLAASHRSEEWRERLDGLWEEHGRRSEKRAVELCPDIREWRRDGGVG